MALTPEQKSSRLFKKSLGAGETLLARDFFEEPRLGNTNILPSQIWSDESKIPSTAPSMSNLEVRGVLQYFVKLSLTHVAGSNNLSYYNENLKDTIPFNYDINGSYNYSLYKGDGVTQIAFGDGDWLVDTSAGLLTFYGTLPSNVSSSVPPQITFYKYVGDKGIVQSGATNGLNIKDPVRVATISGQTLSNYSINLSGFTSIPSVVDGVTSFTNGNRILVKNQTDARQNGIFVVSGSTLLRGYDADGTPIGEVGVNDYVFVTSGNTNIASSWVLNSTDAFYIDKIKPGRDTQTWILFANSISYTTDGLAIKLNGQQFSLKLDSSGTPYNSGLVQSSNGLRINDTLSNIISGNSSSIISLSSALSVESSTRLDSDQSLSTAISIEVSNRISFDDSLSTALEEVDDITANLSTGDLVYYNGMTFSGTTNLFPSLSTAISTEISRRTSADESLLYIITNLSGVTSKTAGSGLTYNGVEQTLNVNVDDWTIKIDNDVLIGAKEWLQYTTTANISTNSGSTGLVLQYDPVSFVSAYINGVEYLVNTDTHPDTDAPFFYNQYPPVMGTQIWFDPVTAGFKIESGIDYVSIKYSFVN